LRTIAHISDLHFGRVDHAILPALAKAVTAANPDVVVVSGDLTQRARPREFAEARGFLNTLPSPQIIVPGNHDVPLYDVVSRWLTPLANYRRFIGDNLEPFYADDEIAVQGINTARSLTFKGGRINSAQVAGSCARMAARPADTTRIVVTHHPFDLADTEQRSGLVGRADMAMAAFARCGIDIILTGHLHVSRTGSSAVRYRIAGYSALMIQAGTATSSRRRGERNAWNIIRIERPQVVVECRTWDEARASFALSRTDRFQLSADGWRPLPTDATTDQA
jgi:3',5'-cyclic AMP phosphodiesterase CpdA